MQSCPCLASELQRQQCKASPGKRRRIVGKYNKLFPMFEINCDTNKDNAINVYRIIDRKPYTRLVCLTSNILLYII